MFSSVHSIRCFQYSSISPPLRHPIPSSSYSIRGLLNADNKDLSLQFAQASDRAQECVFYLRPEDANEVLSDLEAVILNTETRSKAFLMWGDQSGGQVFPGVPFSQRNTSCVAE